MKPTYEVEEITPTIAERYLSKSRLNRPLHNRTVDRLANVMTRGLWQLTNQGLAFDSEGWLVDGQHRLASIIRSSVTVQMLVARNVSHEVAIQAIDSGSKRTPGQRLAMMGEANGNSRASICRYVSILLSEEKASHETWNPIDDRWVTDEYRAELDELAPLKTPPGLRLTGVPRGIMCLMLKKDPERGRVFVDGLVTGQDLSAGSPILLLRNKLTISARGEVMKRDQFVWTLASAAAHLSGERLTKMPNSASDRYVTFAKRLKIPINASVHTLISRERVKRG